VLIDYLEPHEPFSSRMVAPLLDRGLGWRAHRAWLISNAAGDPVGAVVLERFPLLGSWAAHVFLEDAEWAADAARIVQRCPARSLVGADDSVEAVRPFVTRASKNPKRHWFYTIPTIEPEERQRLYAIVGMVAPDGIDYRLATRTDLPEVLSLYGDYELNGATPLRVLRREMEREVDRGRVAVAVADHRIVAASSVRRGRLFAIQSSITVAPEQRGRSIGAYLADWQSAQESTAGRGLCGERATTNGMTVDVRKSPVAVESVSSNVALAPRFPFRGRERLRVALVRVQGRRASPRRTKTAHSQVPDRRSGT
jgi:hypothetical protein